MSIKVVATNRKAYHNYSIEDTYEAGIALSGSEIKSIRVGRVSLGEAYVRLEGGELWLINAHVARYEAASHQSHEPTRMRKLLLHRREIVRLFDQVRIRGRTIIPTKMYLRRGRAKLEIALATGKKKYDKRREIAKRDAAREVERALRRKGRK